MYEEMRSSNNMEFMKERIKPTKIHVVCMIARNDERLLYRATLKLF